MNIEQVKALYPNAKEADYPNDDEQYFNYFDGLKYLHIYKEEISNNEAILLNMISIDRNNSSKWYAYLIKGINQNFKDDTYQCIHFYVDQIGTNREAWLTNFKSFFEDFKDCFFIDENSGVLIRAYSQFSTDKIDGFISLLDDDFSTKTSLYLGLPIHLNALQKVFKEEQKLFKLTQKSHQISTLSDAYLGYYVIPHLNASPMFNELKKYMDHDQELKKVIHALWDAQGNLSAASKSLHLHRNTLIYRIDKLEQDIDINLRDIKELFLAYLLTF